MKFTVRSLAHAVIDLAETLPVAEHTKLFDAALHMLEQRGLSREIRSFPKLLKAEWHKKKKTVPASLVTPSGKAGTKAHGIAAMLEKSLGKKIILEESAEPALIGGARLSFGDERLDLSIKTSLEQFETHVRSSLPSLSS